MCLLGPVAVSLRAARSLCVCVLAPALWMSPPPFLLPFGARSLQGPLAGRW